MSRVIHACITTRAIVQWLRSRVWNLRDIMPTFEGTLDEAVAELEKTPDRVYPIGDRCDNFDDVKGCLGHPVEDPHWEGRGSE